MCFSTRLGRLTQAPRTREPHPFLGASQGRDSGHSCSTQTWRNQAPSQPAARGKPWLLRGWQTLGIPGRREKMAADLNTVEIPHAAAPTSRSDPGQPDGKCART